MGAYQFKIQIKDIQKPPVWRLLLVADNITFDEFHEVIQIAFGWDNYHLYQFSPKGYGSTPLIMPAHPDIEEEDADDSEITELSEIFTKPKQTFLYIYDFGDDWKHQITLEKISDETLTAPVCIDGKGACPPEDCGGPWGYANLLEILADPGNPEYGDMREWLCLDEDEQFDVNAFDIDEVNLELKLMGM
jgi:hypothetical protein